MKRSYLGLAAIALLVIGLALPVQAASFKAGDTDLTLGGSARLDVGWRFSDFGDQSKGSAEIDDKDSVFLGNPGNSRVFMKAVNGKLAGYAELGLGTGSDISTRHIYLTYDMGGGNSVLIGRTWTPVAEDSPNQRLFYDDGMQFFGDLYFDRADQIRFEHTQDKLTFKAAIQAPVNNLPVNDVIDTIYTPTEITDTEGNPQTIYVAEDITFNSKYDLEAVLPAINLAMSYDGGNFTITPSLYAQTVKFRALDEEGPFSKDITATSYALAVDAAFKADPLTISCELWWGQNLAVAANLANGIDRDFYNADFGMPGIDYDANGSDINDVNSYGGWIQLAANLKPGTLYCGFGYQNAEVQDEPSDEYEDDVSTWGAFINYEYPIAKGFTVTPELLYVNYGTYPEKGDNDLGDDIFVGLHFQYDF